MVEVFKSALGRGVIVTIGAQAAGWGIAYLIHVALARWMGAGQYGIYVFIVATMSMAVILARSGMPLAAMKLLSEFRVQKRWGSFRRIFIQATRSTTVTSVVLVGVGLVVAFLVPVELRTGTKLAFVLGLFLIPFTASLNLYSYMLRSLGQVFWAFTPNQLLRQVVLLASLTIAFLLAGKIDPVVAIGLTLCALAFAFVIQRIAFTAALPDNVKKIEPDRSNLGFFRISFPLFLEKLFGSMSGPGSVLVTGLVLGAPSAGFFYVAERTAKAPNLLLSSVTEVASPRIPKLLTRGDRGSSQRFVYQVATFAFWPTLIAGLALAAFTPFILSLFGPAFERFQVPVLLILGAYLFGAAVGPAGQVLRLGGKHDLMAAITAVFGVAQVLATIVGALAAGILGVAIAFSAIFVCKNLVINYFCFRSLGIRASIWGAMLHLGLR